MATSSGTAVGSTKTFSNSMVYDHLGRRASLAESLSGSSPNSDIRSFVFDGSDLVYRQFEVVAQGSSFGTQWTLLDQPDFNTLDNGVLYIYGPTGLVMEFDRSGYSNTSRTMLFDPNGSCVETVDGTTSIYPVPRLRRLPRLLRRLRPAGLDAADPKHLPCRPQPSYRPAFPRQRPIRLLHRRRHRP